MNIAHTITIHEMDVYPAPGKIQGGSYVNKVLVEIPAVRINGHDLRPANTSFSTPPGIWPVFFRSLQKIPIAFLKFQTVSDSNFIIATLKYSLSIYPKSFNKMPRIT